MIAFGRSIRVRAWRYGLLALWIVLAASMAQSQLDPGSMDVHWNQGSPDCAKDPQPPLQVHAYNPRTFILRENLCLTFEAPFIYLLVGSGKALLIDTGDVADSKQMPLAETVMQLVNKDGSAKLPLLVVHTHRHSDHRRGDAQFAQLSNVQVVGFDIDSIRRFYNFTDWPNGLAQIDLGDRIVDVIPTPGHNPTEISFYDRNTGLFFSGDFLMPGRLLISEDRADLGSAKRVASFVSDRPVSFVLGGHIELDSSGRTFPWGSQYHPDEHVLQMTKDDLLALPAAISSFNGFYSAGRVLLINSIHILTVLALVAAVVVILLVLILARYLRRRRAKKLRVGSPD